MPEFNNPFNNPIHFSLEVIVIGAICSIVLVSLLFFCATILKKFNRIKETKLKNIYEQEIEELLFDYLFSEKSTKDVINSSIFQNNLNSKLFQRVATKSIIALHNNYTGIYSGRLENFYAESGLCKYSLNKLNSKDWPNIVEGIRDLSTLNYQKSYPEIVSYKTHKNSFVVFEAMLGMIKLKGITEVLKFKDSQFYLNDWVQSNILFTVKKHNIAPPSNLLNLLESKNSSIVLLAVRLINHYKFADHYSILSQYYQNTQDDKLKREISIVLKKTEQLY